MTATLSADQARAWRVARQHLDARAPRGAMLTVVSALCGVQTQLKGSADLALWARVDGLRRGAVDRGYLHAYGQAGREDLARWWGDRLASHPGAAA